MHTKLRAGVAVLGLASIAAGILDVVWGEFERAHQPIQAWGDHIPGVTVFAYLVAVCLIAGGGAILWDRTRKAGAVVLALVYGAFTIFWLPRLYTAPSILGFHPSVILGVLAGVGTQLFVVAGAVLVFAPDMLPAARWIMGLSVISFGLGHLTNIAANAGLVPAWIPPNRDFWVVLTGIAFVMAGVAMLTRVQDVLASRLLTLMFFVFAAIALFPLILAHPHEHVPWGANAYNLAALGSAWIYAEGVAMAGMV